MGQHDILFLRKSSGQISRTKVSTWSGKENSAKCSKLGVGREVQCCRSRCLGCGQELKLLIPPARICLARCRHLHPTIQEKKPRQPPPSPSVQKQREWALVLVGGIHPPCQPTHQIWPEQKRAVQRRALQPRDVALTAMRGTGSRPGVAMATSSCAGSKHPMGKSELAAPASPPFSQTRENWMLKPLGQTQGHHPQFQTLMLITPFGICWKVETPLLPSRALVHRSRARTTDVMKINCSGRTGKQGVGLLPTLLFHMQVPQIPIFKPLPRKRAQRCLNSYNNATKLAYENYKS